MYVCMCIYINKKLLTGTYLPTCSQVHVSVCEYVCVFCRHTYKYI